MTVRPWEDKAGELATSAVSGRHRGQKVIRGTNMVTPRGPLVLKENGRTEELIPGVHRFARDYPVVRQHPEWFRACDSADIETIRRHRQLAERKLKRLGGTTRATTRPQKRFSLGPGRGERWRLP